MNKLQYETSPYLLQHAHNPVDWYPWGKEALEKARREDKPMLVSIGYSSCHWCHVMEKESFEDHDIAAIMNEYYVCIKVDREERPDVDAIYMDAVQLMGVNGGWPLNVFLTPAGKPFFGGTYFPTAHWASVLRKANKAFREARQEIESSADKITGVLSANISEKYGLQAHEGDFKPQMLEQMYDTLAQYFDKEQGGVGTAPKFPMPSIYEFLLRYYAQTQNKEALEHAVFSLKKMAWGGIYDQIGGGFARYSVDAEWMVPHFEKMLYDNAQLLSVYAQAYQASGEPLFKEIILQTAAFLSREMQHREGGFYAALDADSEGEEGKYYVWETEELRKHISPEDFELFSTYYNIEEEGNWEEAAANILYRNGDEDYLARAKGLHEDTLTQKVHFWKKTLLAIRAERVRPGLDDKMLAAWNGLTIKGFAQAYAATGESLLLRMAKEAAAFIEDKLLYQNCKLLRTYKNGEAKVPAFLEDYALVIEGYTELYQVCFEEKWLQHAKKLCEYALQNFYDGNEKFFFYTDSDAEALITRKKEVFDNVIPASNSVMARNLYTLGLLLDEPKWREIAENMLRQIAPLLPKDARFLSNWASLYSQIAGQTAEIAISGCDYKKIALQLHRRFYPNKIICASETESTLPLLKARYSEDKTLIYVCRNYTCGLPADSLEQAWTQMQE
ncbi:MAG: thioredoxin domain-containing protein [Bernardetiaceae bacterium]|nr:thioredoxin domain-containing protein [Bernardetiaceae bacterium]